MLVMLVERISEQEFKGLLARHRSSVQVGQERAAIVRYLASDLWAKAQREGPLKLSVKDPVDQLLWDMSLNDLKPEGATLLNEPAGMSGTKVFYLKIGM